MSEIFFFHRDASHFCPPAGAARKVGPAKKHPTVVVDPPERTIVRVGFHQRIIITSVSAGPILLTSSGPPLARWPLHPPSSREKRFVSMARRSSAGFFFSSFCCLGLQQLSHPPDQILTITLLLCYHIVLLVPPGRSIADHHHG
jgi:hypothetical protein